MVASCPQAVYSVHLNFYSTTTPKAWASYSVLHTKLKNMKEPKLYYFCIFYLNEDLATEQTTIET
jgi:hypothetical protein